jgi:hypothetical protein
MASEYYDLCFEAVLARQQLMFTYRDRQRQVCPHVLGLTKSKEMLLGFQFAGETSGTLPPGGEWRCFQVAEIHSMEARDGEWHTGSGHSQTHSCVSEVDLDVNPDAPQRSWARHLRKG